MAKSPVQTFGKYQILGRIATGGMAEIYKARLEGIGGFQRTFAIKRILPHLSSNSEYVAMLVDEAKVAGLLSHANIVQILDLGQVDGVWYIAMEFVDGRDLGAVLKRVREKGLSLPLPHTIFTAIELLKGLEYAHQRQVMRGGKPVPLNIIHRDVSPPNILLSFQGEVKLTDFGIARASHKALETHSGVIKGRFDYMSPEQATAAKDLDQRSDLFSVGVVLYEMLTGKHPFRCETEYGTLEKVRTGTYEPLSAVNPGIPFTLETIVDRSLRVDRNDRYPSATAFKEALDKFFHDSGFIFTHSTLAAYVQSLFPDSRPRKAAATASPGQDGFEDEGPTRLVDRGEVDREASRQARRAAEEEAARTSLPESEESTLIRKSPLSPMTPSTPSEWAEEQETLIKRSPFPTPAPTEPPASRRTASPLPTAARLTPPPMQQQQPRKGGGMLGLLGLALSFVLFVMGLMLGTAVAVGALFASGFAYTSPPVLPLQPDPMVRVEAPAEAEVYINGIPVEGERNVSPDELVTVMVRTADGVLYEESFTLALGQQRVVVVHGPAPEVP